MNEEVKFQDKEEDPTTILSSLNEQKPQASEKYIVNHTRKLQKHATQGESQHTQLIIKTKAFRYENKLSLVREVQYENQLVIITDEYQFNSKRNQKPSRLSTQDSKIEYTRKKLLIKKELVFNKGKKRNFKNSVKNLTKGFYTWSKINYQKCRISENTLQLIESQIKQPLNNKIIVTIANCHKTNRLFYQFLDQHGQQFIKKSKIKDKESHFVAIRHYKNIIQSVIKVKSQSEKEESNQVD